LFFDTGFWILEGGVLNVGQFSGDFGKLEEFLELILLKI
jgi:hypothetical protein